MACPDEDSFADDALKPGVMGDIGHMPDVWPGSHPLQGAGWFRVSPGQCNELPAFLTRAKFGHSGHSCFDQQEGHSRWCHSLRTKG